MKKILYLFPLFLLLSGCMPFYQPQKNVPTVPLKVSPRMQNPAIVVNGVGYRLKVDKKGYTRIPAGECITLMDNYNISVASCSPKFLFAPEAGEKYYANFDIKGQYCTLSVFRYSADNKVGLETVYPDTVIGCALHGEKI